MQNKPIFNVTYYPVLQNIKRTLAGFHLKLTPDVAQKDVFTNVPIISFKRSLKDHLIQAVLPKVNAESRSKPCGGKKGVVKYLNQ